MAEEKKQLKKKKRKKKISKKLKVLLFVIPGIILVVGAAAFVFIFVFRGSITMERAVKNYFNAVANQDVDEYIRVCYPSKWSDNYHPNGNDVDLKLLVENVFKMQSDTKVTDVIMHHEEKLEDVFVQRIQDKIKELYDIDLSISAVYRVYFKLRVSYIENGDERQYESDIKTRYVYKHNGKWYYLADTMLLLDMDLDEQ